MNAARSGQPYSNTYSRPQKLWLAEEHDIGDLMGPISKLFALLGYGDAHEERSCAAALGQGIEGYRHARNYPITALIVQQRSREMMLDAFKDAQGAWSSFFRDKSAAAPFPITWLSEESTCDMALEATKKSACTFTEWSASRSGVAGAGFSHGFSFRAAVYPGACPEASSPQRWHGCRASKDSGGQQALAR